MAKDQNNRLRPAQMQADMDAYMALQAIENYTPANTTYNLEAVGGKLEAMKGAQNDEFAIQNALATARDASTAAEWEFHNFMLSVKEQIIAQFGKSSDQVQALGLKKKTEYKARARKAKAA
jgi:hypothetical protein